MLGFGLWGRGQWENNGAVVVAVAAVDKKALKLWFWLWLLQCVWYNLGMFGLGSGIS